MGCINEKYKLNGGFMQARTLAFSYSIAKDTTPSRGPNEITRQVVGKIKRANGTFAYPDVNRRYGGN